MQKTAARSQSNTAPTFGAKGETEELPPLSGRLIVPRPFLDVGHEPTETEELTETETGEIKSDDDEVQKPISPTCSQSTLLSICELVDRLAQVNRQEPTDNQNSRSRSRRNTTNDSNHLMNVEDMTAILKHINLSEASDTPIRWDLIRQQTSAVTGVDQDESMSTGSWVSSSPEATMQQVLFMLENEEIDNSGGFSLEPTSHSCSSSVTWCEGSLFEEVEVMSDEDDAELLDESQSWET